MSQSNLQFNSWPLHGPVSLLPRLILTALLAGLPDTEGRIRYRIQGDIEWDSEEVVSTISGLVNDAKENTP